MLLTGLPPNDSGRNLIALLALAGFVAWTVLLWSYSMDDAFISFRYAEHLAHGHGLTFNIGDKPVEGYSNFLWILLLAGLHLIGLPTYLSAKCIGLAGMLAAGFMWYRYFSANRSDLTWLAGPLFLLAPITAFWGLSGLELGLHSFLIAAAFVAYRSRSLWIHPVLALIILSRPEGPVIAALLVAVGWLTRRQPGRAELSYHATALAVVVLGSAALIGFRLAVFGYPLPNTYYVKAQAPAAAGYIELAGMLLRFAPITLGLLFAFAAVVRRRFAVPDIAPAVALVAAQAAITASVDPIMNHFFRYMIPVLPLMLAAALYVIGELPGRYVRPAAVVIMLASLMIPAPALIRLIPENNAVVSAQMNAIEWLARVPSPATISISDLGRIPYYTQHRYHDIYGLANEDIGHHGFNGLRELSRLPDYFVFVGQLEADRSVALRFWREKSIAYRKAFPQLYEVVEVCTPDSVPSAASGYNYVIARRLPGAEERFREALARDEL